MSNAKEDQIAQGLCRLLVTGDVLSANAQVKALELEGSSKSKVKFGKEVVPKTRALLQEIFHYDLVDMDGNMMVVNTIPDSLKALKYSFCAKKTIIMDESNDIKQFLAMSENGLMVYGEGLPKPVNASVEKGFLLLVIFLIVIYGNRIKQSELEEILTEKFGIVHLPVSLKELETRWFIQRKVSNEENSKRKSKDAVDPSLIVVELGKRTLAEWGREQLLRGFSTVLSGSWNDQMERRCNVSLDKIFSQ